MNAVTDDPQYKAFMKGFDSKDFISSSMGSLVSGYDYVVFLGSYPIGENHVAAIKLTNFGYTGSQLSNTYFETAPASSPLSLASGAILGSDSLFVGASSGEPVGGATAGIGNILGVRFNPSVTGRFTNSLTYTYTTGEYVNLVSGAMRSRTIKVLVVADAVSAFPNLSADVYDFDVLEQDGVDPIVTMQATPTPVTLATNNNTPTPPKVSLSSIKLSAPTSKDTYVKKRIVFKNTSATNKLYNLKLSQKATTTAMVATSSIFVNTASMDVTTVRLLLLTLGLEMVSPH